MPVSFCVSQFGPTRVPHLIGPVLNTASWAFTVPRSSASGPATNDSTRISSSRSFFVLMAGLLVQAGCMGTERLRRTDSIGPLVAISLSMSHAAALITDRIYLALRSRRDDGKRLC